jgi:hypothetical protein
MATTTNYGWTTPDDTALVKDGASAIRTLGSSVDTTTKNLNPETTLGDISFRSSTSNVNTRIGIGTSGQSLTVVAGAPSWAASPTSVLTTTGDTLYASAANTLARLGIGTTVQVLTVAAGLPSWATSASGGMTLISTTTLSGASVTLSSIPQTYNNLRIVIRKPRPVVDSAGLRIRFNSDSTANRQRSDPYYSDFYYDTAFAFNTNFGQITTPLDDTTTQGLTIVDIFDYTNTTTWKMAEYLTYNNDYTTTTQWEMRKGVILYNQTAAVSSLDFFMGSGDMTSGDLLLYGVK